MATFAEPSPVAIHLHTGGASSYNSGSRAFSLSTDQQGDTVLGVGTLSNGSQYVIYSTATVVYAGVNYGVITDMKVAVIDSGGSVTTNTIDFSGSPSSPINAQSFFIQQAPLTDGGFVMVENVEPEGGTLNAGNQTNYFEVFNNSGTPVTGWTQFGDSGATGQNGTMVLQATTTGGFVIAWSEGDEVDQYYQNYNAQGVAVGSPVHFFHAPSVSATSGHWSGQMAEDPSGYVMVGYQSNPADISTSAQFAIFNSSGTKILEESYAAAASGLSPPGAIENNNVQQSFIALSGGGFLATVVAPTSSYGPSGFAGYNVYIEKISVSGSNVTFGTPALVETVSGNTAPLVIAHQLSNGEILLEIDNDGFPPDFVSQNAVSFAGHPTYELIDLANLPANSTTLVSSTNPFGTLSPSGSQIVALAPDATGGIVAALQTSTSGLTTYGLQGNLDTSLYVADFNTAPTANPDINANFSGHTVSSNVLTNDTDPNGLTLSVTGFTDGSSGTVGTSFSGTYGDITIDSNGNYSYSAGATSTERSHLASAPTGSHPTEVITYTASDGGASASSTLTITLDRAPATNNISEAVVAGTSTATFTSGTAGTGALRGDTDPDADSPVIIEVQANSGNVTALTLDGSQHNFAGNYGTLSIAYNGIYSYTANSNIASPTGSHPVDTFTLTIGDNGGSATAAETLTFNVDRAPTLTLNVPSVTYTSLGSPQALQTGVTISDPDGSDAIASAKVTVTGGYASDGDLLSYHGSLSTITLGDGSQYSVAYAGAGTAAETLTFTTLSGAATQTDYIQLIDGVVFSSTATDPTNAGANLTRSANFQVTDTGGATSATAGPETVNIQLAPTVSSIAAVGSSPNNASSDQFTVTFSEAVTGVDASDFTATTTGNVADTGILVSAVSASVYTVTVTGVTGDGTLGLDLNSSGTGITDAAGNAIAGGFTSGQTYTIEHTAPAVTSVGVPASATYIAGQELDFTVHFSETVFVNGTPELALTLDTGGTVPAKYLSGSGTSALTFGYTVISGEGDTNGVAVGSAILLNGGSVRDAASNDAVLTLQSVADSSGVLVDSIPPTVTSVVAPANGTYGPGETLDFTVDFSENVLVTTGGGTPYIDVTLDTGGTKHAVYIGGSGTNQLTFEYTVANGNDDTNGVALGSSIVLNGGSIKDAATNAATLTLNNVASTTGVLVDAIPPTVTSIDTVDASTNNLSTEHFTVTFSTAVNGVDASDFVVGFTGTVYSSPISVTGSGTTWTVTVDHVVGDGTLELDLTNTGDPITDNFGKTLTASHTGDQRYTIEHTPPAVTSVLVPGATTYGASQYLDFIPTFSEAVTVTGTPRIAITLDTGGTVYATYLGGSGTNALTFQYEVKPGDQDYTGIVTGTAIDLNGGAITDAAGNAASGSGLNLTGEPSTAGVYVDAIAPAVSSVTVPVNGTSGVGQELAFTVYFNKVVNVNTGGGDPYLQLTLDTGGNKPAVYLSGSGSSALTFGYVIESGECDGNGITVGSSLVLNGGTIQDALGNDVAVALNNVGSTTGVLVDSIPPTVTSIDTVDAGTNNLHTEHFTVTFSKDVSLHPPDTTDFTLHATGTVGGTVSSVTAVSGSTYTVTVTNVTGDGTLSLDLDTLGRTITDAYGNVLAAAHPGDQSYTIDHTAPGAPTVVLAHDTGTSNTDGITSNPAISVTPAESGGTLLYKIDGATVFSTTAPNFATDGSAEGPHTVSVEQEDAAGNIGAATTLSFVLDTIAPGAPTSAASLAQDTGVSATDHITSNPTLVYASPAAGDYFLFKVDNGSYSTTQPAAFATDHSADGTHTISVEEVDAAGNISAPASFSFTLDTVAPAITAVTATPSNGIEGVGQTIAIVLAFGEAVAVLGGTPTLSLNDNGTATYEAAATAALNDPTKLAFDYTVSTSDTITSPLAVTGITLHGAVIEDAAGNVANLGNVDTTFTGLGVDTSLVTANPDSTHVLANQTVTADAAHGVLANDTDSNPADHLAVSAVDGLTADVNRPVAGAYGSLTVHADGSYSYTANNTAGGVAFDTFTYTASNGHSAPSTSTLSVEVVGGNQNFVIVPSGGSATGGYGNTVLDGSAGHTTLTAATTFNAHQVLVGGDGDTLNAASYGQDTFVFANNFGHDTINNFLPALDVIELQQSQFGSLANVLADIHQVGPDSVLTLDASHVVTIAGIQHASLTAADFHLV